MQHGGRSGCELAAAIRRDLADPRGVSVVVAPPFTALAAVSAELDGSAISVAGQNMHAAGSGAFTGEISAAMLKEAGASWVILGHSERRQLFGETDAGVAEKTGAALAAGLRPIVCVGETLAERDAGRTFDVVLAQVAAVTATLAPSAGHAIAYEPVWAIGTGRNATAAQAEEVHARIRALLAETSVALAEATPILYGGSVKPDNAAALLSCPNVDGALVGGASLDSRQFLAIVAAAHGP
ncbi:MAG: triose-phosphate isomerase [Polyangiaceae bacterium]|nr:triose-phosphate isomerase [Polyangiaceae bacterium]